MEQKSISYSKLGSDVLNSGKYALIFLFVSALMGLIYGAFGGIWYSMPFVAVTYTGIFVVINFMISLIVFVINLIPSMIKKGSWIPIRYFIWSLSFFVVFMIYFSALKFSGLEPF